MIKLKNATIFIEDLINKFPEIKDDILNEDDIITLQMGCFMRFTQNAINQNNWSIVSQCFEFANNNLGKVEHKIENALYLSYLGKLEIEKNSKTEKLMPSAIRKAYSEIKAYESKPSGNNKLNDFLNNL